MGPGVAHPLQRGRSYAGWRFGMEQRRSLRSPFRVMQLFEGSLRSRINDLEFERQRYRRSSDLTLVPCVQHHRRRSDRTSARERQPECE